MKIFKDKALKEEVTIFDFGIVSAGESKTVEYFMKNETEATVVDLKCSIANQDVKILTSPTKLDSGETSSLILKWSPAVTLRKGLKTEFHISGTEIYGSN